jgi:3-dehydroquinate synthase
MVKADSFQVLTGPLSETGMQRFISKELDPSSVVIITDAHTHEHCLAYLLTQVPVLQQARIIQIAHGEESKNIETCVHLWQTLIQFDCDRNTLIINLGGGVITDLGGFIAGTFKRGIRYINVPTTLLAQVDASVGNKTGIDLGTLKNQVGIFCPPEAVYVDTIFLKTLNKRELLSGFAEMIKHSLLDSAAHWKKVKDFSFNKLDNLAPLIEKSIAFKNSVIKKDPDEKGFRKILNFGHTIGHAIESFSLESDRKELKHGEAVAIGMIAELYLSVKKAGFPKHKTSEIESFIIGLYPVFPFDSTDINRLIEIMRSDKKNSSNRISFSLLKDIGNPGYDFYINGSEINEALVYYRHIAQHASRE